MIINVTGSPPASAFLKNTAQTDNSKRFSDFDEQVFDEISKFSDDDKLRNIIDLNNPAYALAQSGKPFEPIKNTEISRSNVVNDKTFADANIQENNRLSKENAPDAAKSQDTNTNNSADSKKEATSEPASVNITAEKPKSTKKNEQMANIDSQESSPKLIISQKAEPESIENNIQNFKNNRLSKLISPDNNISVQGLPIDSKENSSEAKSIQEAFKQLNGELKNSSNHLETKEISRFATVEKTAIESEKPAQENLVKQNEPNEQPVRESRAKDGTGNYAENPDPDQNDGKGKESKADTFNNAVNFGNISKAYQKANTTGITSPLPPQKVEVSEFTQRTMQMVKTLPANGTTSAKLILSPPALGSLHIEISLKADYVRMSIKAENQDTMKMIENQIGALRDKLAENGLKTEKIELSYRNENQDKQLDAGQEQQRRNEEDKKLRRDFLRTFSGGYSAGEEEEDKLIYIPASGNHLTQRNLTGV